MFAIVKARQGLLGLVLIAVFWPLNWFLPGLRTAYLFFPLWLGYVLTVDAWVFTRTQTSLLTRSRRDFAFLFVVSAPAWWLFEVLNWRTQNWEYLGGELFGRLEYFILSTLSFSTVMPAVFETAELVRSFDWTKRFAFGPRCELSTALWPKLLAGGVICLMLVYAWPRFCYPLVWFSIFLIVEPLNIRSERPHLFRCFSDGDWRPVVSLSLGALFCGFFWEMWNLYSYPKWIYHTPGAQFLHVFEMPLLGYLGYIPFAWELYAIRTFLWPHAPELRI